jgi:hypothetical protein
MKAATFMLLVVALSSGCARKVVVETTNAQWRSNCSVNTWWIEAPQELVLGTLQTVPVRRCEGKATPSELAWSISNPAIIQLISTTADQAVIKAVARGDATLSVKSVSPVGTSVVRITVK